MPSPTRIAIVAMNALPVVLGQRGRIGGLETFAWNLARGLVAGGVETALVVRADRNPGVKSVDGVRLLADVEPLRETRRRISEQVEFPPEFPWLRIRRWSSSLLWEIPILVGAKLTGSRKTLTGRMNNLLSEFSPDVVIALGVSAESRAAIESARHQDALGLLWLQSNADLDPRWNAEPEFRNEYGVASADARTCLADSSRIITQTEFQRSRLKDLTGRDGSVVRNPIDLTTYLPGPVESRRGVLWIGRYDRFHKRPLLAVEIAKRCPGVPFMLVINEGDSLVAGEISRLKPDNVTIVDSVPRPEMPARFRETRVFLSTGSIEHEGFPNVLLEAAASGTPTVSLEDFDGFLQASQAGIATNGDLDTAAAAIRRLNNDADHWKTLSTSARRYVEHHHSMYSMLAALQPMLTAPNATSG